MKSIQQMSDEELMAIAYGSQSPVDSMSDDELMKIAGVTIQPSNNASKEEWDSYYKATVKPSEPSMLETEVASPIRSALSTGLTGGFLKEGIGAVSPEMKARMFPEQKTVGGKLLRGTAETTAAVLGFPGKVVGMGLQAGARIIPKAILPASKIASGSAGQKLASSALGGALGGASLAAENLDIGKQAGQVVGGAAIGGVLPIVASPIQKALVKTDIDTQIRNTVKHGIQKAVKPSSIGKQSLNLQEKYFDKAVMAVDDVIANKASLEIVDKSGNVAIGRTPKSLAEALQAVNQTKESLFKRYSPMIVKASDEGAVVDGSDIARKLKAFASQKNVQLSNPSLAKYALNLSKRWDGQTVTLQQADKTLRDINAMVKTKYSQGRMSGADVSNAQVDNIVANYLRKNISEKAGIGELKVRYGALAELEGDIAKRAFQQGNQGKSFLEKGVDVLSAGEISGGVLATAVTGNPSHLVWAMKGATMKTVNSIMTTMNSPDRNISKMFSKTEELLIKKARKIQ